jgi:predicted PhzF superfamily epimerase YddE/YHI9
MLLVHTARIHIDVLRVFCGPGAQGGSVLGVVRDGRPFPGQAARLDLAERLGFGHTVFVDDPESGAVDVYRCEQRLPFTVHALIGAAWLLDLEILEPEVGEVFARHDGEFSWITAHMSWVPPRPLRQYASGEEVEALAVPEPAERSYAWGWQDEAAGRIRSRALPKRGGGDEKDDDGGEEEATGAGALLLAHHLGRALNIAQGNGAQLLAAPSSDGTIEVGGRVRLEDTLTG